MKQESVRQNMTERNQEMT